MSLRLRTVLGIALIEALLLALLIYTVMKYMHDNAEEALLKRAYSTAALFASTAKDPVLSYDLASLETFSRELKTNPDIEYVRTRSPDGLLFASAGSEELVAREFQEDKSLSAVDDGIFDTSARIFEGDVEFARVEIGFNIDSIEAGLAETRQLSTFIAVVEMTLVAIFSFLLGTYLTRQLVILGAAAKKISEGDYSQRLAVRRNDEVGQVSTAFNVMSDALSDSQSSRDQYEKELVELNQTLEERVTKRTDRINAQMTELKSTHEKLANAQAQLLQSEKLASIGQLSAGIAHEINNPIAFVQSNVNTLTEYIDIYKRLIALYQESLHETDLAESSSAMEAQALEQKEDLEFVNEDITALLTDTLEGTNRVKSIVLGLKEFSHVNSEERDACDVVECIESTLRIVNNELKNRCTVNTDFQQIPKVLANQGELKQVIMNLLVNASQAVDEDGNIDVSTALIGEMVEISVTDNGKGIEPENLKKLFDPFFTTKPVGVGTGLGLSISYGIIQDHGGTIRVDSKLDSHTTFTIVLPAYNEDKNQLFSDNRKIA